NTAEAWRVIKINSAKINILVLRSRAPVRVECVLQAATDHPTDVCFYLLPTFVKKEGETTDALEKIEITNGESTGYIRQPLSKGVTNSWPNRNQIMCFERCLDIEVPCPPACEKSRFHLNYAARGNRRPPPSRRPSCW